MPILHAAPTSRIGKANPPNLRIAQVAKRLNTIHGAMWRNIASFANSGSVQIETGALTIIDRAPRKSRTPVEARNPPMTEYGMNRARNPSLNVPTAVKTSPVKTVESAQSAAIVGKSDSELEVGAFVA